MKQTGNRNSDNLRWWDDDFAIEVSIAAPHHGTGTLKTESKNHDLKPIPKAPINLKDIDARVVGFGLLLLALFVLNRKSDGIEANARPPFKAEYVLWLFLKKEEREILIGDLVEEYGIVIERFGKRYADLWFTKQVIGSLFPLARRAVLKMGALVWLGQVLRRLIS